MLLYVTSHKEVKRLANVQTLLKTAHEDISEVRLYLGFMKALLRPY